VTAAAATYGIFWRRPLFARAPFLSKHKEKREGPNPTPAIGDHSDASPRPGKGCEGEQGCAGGQPAGMAG